MSRTTTTRRDYQAVRVLLVEDDPDVVDLVRDTLSESDGASTVHDVPDGEDALDFVRNLGDYADAPRPNLILFDWGNRRDDGSAVLTELQADADLRQVPVIVLTESSDSEDVLRAYELGANAYLPKPVDPEEFIDLVRAVEDFWLSSVRLPPTD